jgi:twinkle protein
MQYRYNAAHPLAEELAATVTQSGKYSCPECTPSRKPSHQNRHDLSITVETDQTLFHCHHCRASGKVTTRKPHETPITIPRKPKPVTEIPTPLNSSKKIIASFFSNRGVDISDTELNGKVITAKKYFQQLNTKLDAVGFVYGTEENVQAIKWRPADTNKKAFTQDDAARSFFGLTSMEKDAKELIIVEGESDVVALASIGVESWSVPNGAPMKVNKGMIDPQEDKKFSYVWEAWDELESAERIVFATDADVQGEALKQELARRIGLEKCWEIHFPEGLKDPTDVLRESGSDALKNLFTNVKPMPLKGVYDVDSYFEEVELLYRDGIAAGESTGLISLDDLFTVKEGMLYITTGFPGGGKSEFIDEIMMNLSRNKSWKWAVASFENPPANHITKLIEKHSEMPFFEGRSQRVSREQLQDARDFLNEHFVFLEQKDGSMATITEIIKRIKLAIARCGVRGAVIDPYNYIDMSHYENEHNGISIMLSELSAFARAHGVAIFFVAHPQKIWPNQDGSMPVPKGSHISGSAAWWAKADIGLTVHRGDSDVQIHCWKARFKWLGQTGQRNIGYNVVNGKYFDKEQSHSDKNKWYRPSLKNRKADWEDIDIPF